MRCCSIHGHVLRKAISLLLLILDVLGTQTVLPTSPWREIGPLESDCLLSLQRELWFYVRNGCCLRRPVSTNSHVQSKRVFGKQTSPNDSTPCLYDHTWKEDLLHTSILRPDGLRQIVRAFPSNLRGTALIQLRGNKSGAVKRCTYRGALSLPMVHALALILYLTRCRDRQGEGNAAALKLRLQLIRSLNHPSRTYSDVCDHRLGNFRSNYCSSSSSSEPRRQTFHGNELRLVIRVLRILHHASSHATGVKGRVSMGDLRHLECCAANAAHCMPQAINGVVTGLANRHAIFAIPSVHGATDSWGGKMMDLPPPKATVSLLDDLGAVRVLLCMIRNDRIETDCSMIHSAS